MNFIISNTRISVNFYVFNLPIIIAIIIIIITIIITIFTTITIIQLSS